MHHIVTLCKTASAVKVHQLPDIISFNMPSVRSLFFIQVTIMSVQHRSHRCVFGFLHPPFDLQRAYTRIDQLRQHLKTTQIFHTQQITLFSGDPIRKAVLQPAGLCTSSPVSAAATDHAAQKALTGIGIAQGPVHKHFDLKAGLILHLTDLIKAELSGQNQPPDAMAGKPDPVVRTAYGHLCAGMDRKIRKAFPEKSQYA